MLYPQLSGEPNFILIGISAVFGLLIIIIVYYIVVSKSANPERLYSKQLQLSNSNNPNGNIDMSKLSQNSNSKLLSASSASTASTASTDKNMPVPNAINSNGYYASASASPQPPQSQSQTQTPQPSQQLLSSANKQVFNIKENIYTLDDANGVCGALGAETASIEQLIDAHKQGADWCNVGWTKDGLAAFPLQYSTWKTLQDNEPNKRNMCGTPGINLVRNDKDLLYGVNCYGIKPEPKQGEKVKQVIQSDAQIALQLKIAQFQKNMNKIGVAPFNQNSWSG
jgi:hypothetical protein